MCVCEQEQNPGNDIEALEAQVFEKQKRKIEREKTRAQRRIDNFKEVAKATLPNTEKEAGKMRELRTRFVDGDPRRT